MAWHVLSNANHWLGCCREIHICSRPSYKVWGHAEARCPRTRTRPRTKFRPRGQSGLEDLASLLATRSMREMKWNRHTRSTAPSITPPRFDRPCMHFSATDRHKTVTVKHPLSPSRDRMRHRRSLRDVIVDRRVVRIYATSGQWATNRCVAASWGHGRLLRLPSRSFPTSRTFILLRFFAKLSRLICFRNSRHWHALSVSLL